MKKVKVNASKKYEILIERGIINNLGEQILKVTSPCKAMVITDSNVDKILGEKVVNNLTGVGYKAYKHVFSAGEKSKTADTVLAIIEDLTKNEFTRSDLIIALGGGVVGDVSGFTASIYLRGIKFIQVPTTLLGAIDSSVGGKTGVDLVYGKNLIGSFYQPSLVVIDAEVIENLPEKIFSEGIAEAIKYGVICDKELFLSIANKTYDLEELIAKCVGIKARIVKKDEFDKGERQLLNLGHTFGHAIEKLSNFTLSHGECVGIGMIKAVEIADKTFGESQMKQMIEKALLNFNLPISTNFSNMEIFDSLKTDKKRFGETINLVLPIKIGDTRIFKTDLNKLKEMMN